jgi:signal transduction histidine kinase
MILLLRNRGKDDMKIHRIRNAVVLCTLTVLMCIFSCFGIRVQAEDAMDKLRIGFLLEGQYGYLDENGDYRGFDAEMAQELALYGDFEAELVPFLTINDALNALDSGKVSMLIDFGRTSDRETRFLYSERQLITSPLKLFARADDNRFAYGDLNQLNGMRIACMNGVDYDQSLIEQCSKAGVTVQLVYYDNHVQMKASLDGGGVDAVLTGTFTPAGYKTVFSFGTNSSYLMFRLDDTATKSRIDKAMARLEADQPLKTTQIYEKYVNSIVTGTTSYTDAEQAYLSTHSIATVALVENAPPFVIRQGGSLTGIVPDFYKKLSEKTGLNFQYQFYSTSDEALQAVEDGKADILGFYFGDTITAASRGLTATDPYVTLNCMLITRRGESGTVKTAAVTDRTNRLLNALLATQNQSIELKPYSKISDCYNALISRQTDAVICTTASAAWIMNSHGMRKINVSSFPGVTLELSGCVRRESNILRSILNKGVSTMGADMQSIIASNTVAESGSLVAVLETASSEVLLIVFTGLVLLIIWLIVMLAENHKHQKEKSEILAAKARNEQRSLQLAAEEKATAEKDSFFSSISHDMRTPLNAIIGFSDLARKEPVTPAVDDYLAKIESSGKLLLELINDTLTISKINSGKMVMSLEPVQSSAIIDPVVIAIRDEAQKKGVIFRVDEARMKDRMIMTSPLYVQKILLNLLSNAVKFTPPGKHVDLILRNEPGDKEETDSVIIVKDEGIGISKEFLPHIYEPFMQENNSGMKGSGSGLGLSIVKKLVDRMGGTIQAESEQGAGTTFTVRLHFQETAAPAAVTGNSTDESVSALRGKKFLLCEDNELNAEIVKRQLQKQGALLDTAEDGGAGVRMFRDSQAHEYAAVLMDLRMPVMDGYEATRQIRALPREDAASVPIIALSADAFQEDIQKCLDAGMNGHIAKPLDPKLMISTIRSLVH